MTEKLFGPASPPRPTRRPKTSVAEPRPGPSSLPRFSACQPALREVPKGTSMELSTEPIECDCDSALERDTPRSPYWRYTCSWTAPPVGRLDVRRIYILRLRPRFDRKAPTFPERAFSEREAKQGSFTSIWLDILRIVRSGSQSLPHNSPITFRFGAISCDSSQNRGISP